ncbi:MAG TPA: PaaI family thioesterase [Alphaproteobacteria bacterium]
MNDPTRPDWDALLSNFNRHLNMKIVEWSDGAATVTLDIDDRMRNRVGAVHGGVIATLIDATAGYAGNFCPHPGRRRISATISMTTSFLAPSKGGRITARATVRGGGRTIYVAAVEVTDEDGTLIAIGEASYRRAKGSETLEGVPIS